MIKNAICFTLDHWSQARTCYLTFIDSESLKLLSDFKNEKLYYMELMSISYNKKVKFMDTGDSTVLPEGREVVGDRIR